LIGTSRVTKADPDGRTFLITIQDSVVLNRFLFKDLPYDPDKSLVPVTMIARTPQLVIANASFSANNMSELVEIARRTPGGIPYGSSGIGSQPFLLFETIAKRSDVRFVHVPYKGIAPTMTAVMTGEVALATGTQASAGPFIEDGKIKVLAVSSPQRLKLFPNVQTLSEAGFSGVDATAWWGIFAPPGTSAATVERVRGDIASVARQPDVEKYFERLGLELVLNSPSEFVDAIRNDVAITAEMVKAAGLKPRD
jgi:tripartite-type tricarboxylate transporter receptor subunit TctC